jgi:hypothetical protein
VFQAARLVPQCAHEICMLMINICTYNHPSKHFATEDIRVVVVLVCAYNAWLTLKRHYASMALEVVQE